MSRRFGRNQKRLRGVAEAALAVANRAHLVADVAKALVQHLIRAKRASLRPGPSTAGLSGTTKEV